MLLSLPWHGGLVAGDAFPRVFLLSFMGVGDNLVMFRALDSVRFERQKIHWVCKSDSAELVEAAFTSDEMFVIHKEYFDTFFGSFYYPVILFVKLWQCLREHKPIHAVILDYKWRPIIFFGLACRLAGIREITSCMDKSWTIPFVTRAIRMRVYENIHEVERYRDLLAIAGLTMRGSESWKRALSLDGLRLRLVPPVQRHGRVVLIAPGSIRPFKRWRPENYHAIVARLMSANLDVVIVGGADDHVLGEEILSGLAPHAGRNLCGRISWRELSSLMENADLLLTNDSAPMHLADLVGLQVIGLFGITQPERCGPYTQRQNCIKASGPESASYSFGSFGTYDESSINSITVTEVWNALVIALKREGRPLVDPLFQSL